MLLPNFYIGLDTETIITYSEYPAMLQNLLDSIEISPKQIKIFLATFIAVSVMVGLQHMGIHSPFAISFP